MMDSPRCHLNGSSLKTSWWPAQNMAVCHCCIVLNWAVFLWCRYFCIFLFPLWQCLQFVLNLTSFLFHFVYSLNKMFCFVHSNCSVHCLVVKFVSLFQHHIMSIWTEAKQIKSITNYKVHIFTEIERYRQ